MQNLGIKMNFMGTGTYAHLMYTVEYKAAKHA